MTKDRRPGQSEPLPTTAELGAEGGSYGDAASRESRERPEDGPDRVRDEAVTDLAGNVIRLPEISPEETAPAGTEMKKLPTE